jgi:hypothetical protein
MENRSDEWAAVFLLMLIMGVLEAVFGAHQRIDDLEDVMHGA